MQSYDREVLVRDLDVRQPSYELYFKHNLYVCQPDEKAEPLFFAPCFPKREIHDGIHYFSRVYFRRMSNLGDSEGLRQAVREASALIAQKLRPLKGRKKAEEQIEYLNSLPKKWEAGLRFVRRSSYWGNEPQTVFYLGNPVRLPVPLKKDGGQVPPDFRSRLNNCLVGGKLSLDAD